MFQLACLLDRLYLLLLRARFRHDLIERVSVREEDILISGRALLHRCCAVEMLGAIHRVHRHRSHGNVRIERIEKHKNLTRIVHHNCTRVAQDLGTHREGFFECAALHTDEGCCFIRKRLLTCLELALRIEHAHLMLFLTLHQFAFRGFSLS